MKRLVVLMLLMGASAAYGEMYTWKDARGTVFYTNSLHEIPARYLKKARVLDVATGKKGGLATAQPVVQGNPATPAGVPGQTVQQTPAVNPVATPAPPVPAGTTPAVASPAPPVPPAVAAPQPQPRETREQRRAQRRPRVQTNVEDE